VGGHEAATWECIRRVFALRMACAAAGDIDWMVTLRSLPLRIAVMKNRVDNEPQRRDGLNAGLSALRRSGTLGPVRLSHRMLPLGDALGDAPLAAQPGFEESP
jgi:hypothetical protein